tara:strand:+ start:697 stop:900 length:204 start_codon:yes stop_codon:yes gene_type:complete
MVELTGDPVVNRIIGKFIKRSRQGMKRFGVSMQDNDASTVHWIENAQEELMDGILYLEKLKWEMNNG